MRKLLYHVLFIIIFLGFSMPSFAAEDTVMIESESNWDYLVVDDKEFEEMDSDWMKLEYKPNWNYGTAPFGDRIVGDNAEAYGWVGENHGIFLRQEFKLRSATVMKDMHFYIRTFYDNSIHIYLNGVEIFANDNGGSSDWVDEYKLYKLEGVAEHLRLGKNVIAVSVHDNAGGREFDLSFFATNDEIDDSTELPPPETPSVTPEDAPSEDIPEDFGNTLPFTKSPANSVPPVVTVYITAEPSKSTVAPSYVAPISMIASSLLIALAMIIIALVISKRAARSGGAKR